jgi:hypothetical protein
MATRGVIAVKTGKNKWVGVYHHWDSYPTNLGKTIWQMIKNKFHDDIEAFIRYAIFEHPAGWSHLFDSFVLVNENPLKHKKEFGSQCYCHGYFAKRDGITPDESHLIKYPECISDPQEQYTNCLFYEWVYILDPKKRTMEIWCNYDTGQEFTVKGVDNYGKPYEYQSTQYAWKSIITISFDDKEPDWDEIEKMGWEARQEKGGVR